MKHKIIILNTFFALVFLSVNAQTPPTPWVYPGNAPTLGDFVGTTNTVPLELKTTATGANAQNMNFYTNNFQKATILGNNGSTDGYMGIGTSAPSNLLHLYNSGTGAGLYCQWSNGNATYTNGLQVGINTSNQGMINMVDNKPIKILTNNVVRMIVDDNGNNGYVGIGTSFTTPFSKLHLHNSGNTDNWFQISTANSVSGSLAATDGLRIGVNDGSQIAEIKQQENADMLISTNATERMRIKAGGNVGIGTSTINSKLTLNNDYAVSSTGQAMDITATGTGVSLTGLKAIVTGTGGTTGMSNKGLRIETSSAANAYNYGADIVVTGTGLAATGINNVVNGVAGVNNLGIYSECNNGNNAVSVYGMTTGGTVTNEGGLFIGSGNASQTYNIGVEGRASDADGSGHLNIGVEGYSDHNNSHTAPCYGVLGYVNVPSAGDYAGYFQGDLHYTGTLSGPSDLFLKDNVTDLSDAMTLINQLNPKTYTFKQTDYPDLNLPSGTRFGLIAEDVQPVLPQLIGTASMVELKDLSGNVIHPSQNYKTMDYIDLIPVLIAAIKEQQVQIDGLSGQLRQINPNGAQGNSANDQMKVELGNGNKIVYLTQNIPNPFKDNTQISFNIPTDVKSASIMFSDNNGNVIKTVEINSRGKNSLMVFGENLSNGIYSYTLIADGKVVDSKRMVKQ